MPESDSLHTPHHHVRPSGRHTKARTYKVQPPVAADTARTDSVAGPVVPAPAAIAKPAATPTVEPGTVRFDTIVRLKPVPQPLEVTHFTDPAHVSLPFFRLAQVDIPTSPRHSGTLRPHTFMNDDAVTCLLLLCFFTVVWAITSSHHILRERVKAFFRPLPKADDSREYTGTELRGRFFAIFQLCFCFSLLYYDYLLEHFPAEGLTDSPYATLGLTTGLTLFYIWLKLGLYRVVNGVFFDRLQRRSWHDDYYLVIVGAGLLMLPLTLLLVYFDLAFEAQYITFICIIGLAKLALLYRTFRTFSGSAADSLHLILYFCALEIVPTLVLWRILLWANINLVEVL